ncbi:hypothetical protein Arub01_55260 [Actinomadura rubrobrunea]|uniref:Uncharacterized protein n=1 Tax=Actinomadura rubrobrunea TaxID=115335 RepID=A0A9W6Q2K7_9ACTN|nr:hypothetical protein Arub01_55260 [Actinomadura rubrobrunea]
MCCGQSPCHPYRCGTSGEFGIFGEEAPQQQRVHHWGTAFGDTAVVLGDVQLPDHMHAQVQHLDLDEATMPTQQPRGPLEKALTLPLLEVAAVLLIQLWR